MLRESLLRFRGPAAVRRRRQRLGLIVGKLHLDSSGMPQILGGSWGVISGVISKVTIVITYIGHF